MSFVTPREVVDVLRLPDKAVVADLGAGTGHYVWALAEKMRADGITGGTIYAIDVQKALLERLKNDADHRGLGNVHILWGDAEREGGTKLADRSCDMVVMSNVLFQIEDKETFVREALRILKPGGEILAVDWSDSYNSMGPHMNHVFTMAMGRALFEKLGLKIKRDVPAGVHHWGLLIRKA